MVADVDARSSTAAEGRVESLYSPGNPVSMVNPSQNSWSAEQVCSWCLEYFFFKNFTEV